MCQGSWDIRAGLADVTQDLQETCVFLELQMEVKQDSIILRQPKAFSAAINALFREWNYSFRQDSNLKNLDIEL